MGRRRGKLTYTSERDIMLFRKYLQLLKRNRDKYGEVSKTIPVTNLYTEAGELFHIGLQQSRHIICRMLKTVIHESDVSLKEFDEMIKELEDSTPSKLERYVMGLDKILVQCNVSKTHEEVKALAQEYLLNFR